MRIFAFYLAKMKYAPALGRISAYICVIISISHVDANCNGCNCVICNGCNLPRTPASFPHGMTATALFAAVATAFPVQTPHELAPHSFCAANMAAAVDNRA